MTAPETGALRLTVMVGEADLVGRKPLYTEIVQRAHASRLRGASVFRGIEGFRKGSAIHTNRLLDLSGDQPVAVITVAEADRIPSFLHEATELWGTGLVTVEDATMVRPGREDPPG
jgi:uncharacterized protein